MREILSSECVELATDLDDLRLHVGDKGRVRSTWHYPNGAYEVEFNLPSERRPLRVLLLEHQVRSCDKEIPLFMSLS